MQSPILDIEHKSFLIEAKVLIIIIDDNENPLKTYKTIIKKIDDVIKVTVL